MVWEIIKIMNCTLVLAILILFGIFIEGTTQINRKMNEEEYDE